MIGRGRIINTVAIIVGEKVDAVRGPRLQSGEPERNGRQRQQLPALLPDDFAGALIDQPGGDELLQVGVHRLEVEGHGVTPADVGVLGGVAEVDHRVGHHARYRNAPGLIGVGGIVEAIAVGIDPQVKIVVPARDQPREVQGHGCGHRLGSCQPGDLPAGRGIKQAGLQGLAHSRIQAGQAGREEIVPADVDEVGVVNELDRGIA